MLAADRDKPEVAAATRLAHLAAVPRMRRRRHAALALLVVIVAGCAANGSAPGGGEDAADVVGEPAGFDTAVGIADGADVPGREPLLDRTRDSVYGVVRGTAQTVDNIFGSADVEEKARVTRGRVALGGQWDERDGLRERLRLKASVALPAHKNRASLLIGRGDADDLVDGSDDNNIDTLPARFNDFEDADWLVGVGYSRNGKLKRGWDFGAGVKVTTPVEPYVRATYHRNKTIGERWLWRLRPRLFWQSQRGAGVSLQNTLDYAATTRWLYRWWTIGVADEETIDGVGWTSKLIAYQNLSRKSALSYAVYASGETGAAVPEQDFGIELRFRRQISRDWLFIELLTFVNWPRELPEEQRETNVGFGLEFEMQFGDWPGRPHD